MAKVHDSALVKKFIYQKHNFFKNTYCIFKAVDVSTLKDKKPDFTSRSGSIYYYTEEGVYRISSHWGRAATCKWRLQTETSIIKNGTKAGFAAWTSFCKDNEVEKLYFIQKSPFTQKFEYYHRDEPSYTDEYILRTAGDTRKVLRQLKAITTETKWAKYVPHDDLEDLRTFLIDGLITSSKTLQELKRKYAKR